jgi:hypothetical protein
MPHNIETAPPFSGKTKAVSAGRYSIGAVANALSRTCLKQVDRLDIAFCSLGNLDCFEDRYGDLDPLPFHQIDA